MDLNREKIIKILKTGSDSITVAEDIILSDVVMVKKIASVILQGKRNSNTHEEIAENVINFYTNPTMDVPEEIGIVTNLLSRRRCTTDVLTPIQFDTLTRNGDETAQYEEIYGSYMKLCKLCVREDVSGYEEFFVKHSNELILTLLDTTGKRISKIMKDALTLMFCKSHNKCTNQDGLNNTLSKSFFNWMSHAAAHMANRIINVDDSYVANIAGDSGTRRSVNSEVKNKLEKHLEKLNRDQLNRVSKLYRIDNIFRKIRAPDRTKVGICGELLDDNHERQQYISFYIRSLALKLSREKNQYEEDQFEDVDMDFEYGTLGKRERD